MAPSLIEESLLAAPHTARTGGPKPSLVAKFALLVATGGLMLRSDGRRCHHHHHHHHLDLAFEVQLSANLITLVLGFLLMYVSMMAPPGSTTTGKDKLNMVWATFCMSVVTLVLGSYLQIFASSFVALG